MITILYKTREKIVVYLHVYVARAIFLLLYDDFMMTKNTEYE